MTHFNTTLVNASGINELGNLPGNPYDISNPEFATRIHATAKVERLWTGGRWCEGPSWFAAGRYLIWSDIPNNRLLRWDECNGVVSVFRQPSNNANGNTLDRQGRLITCEHLSRRITRTEHDGSIGVIADEFQGMRFNSPNDVAVKSDGSIWFSDPSYGILSDYEGDQAASEIGACHVYRWDAHSKQISIVANDYVKPNGVAFDRHEQHLLISDTGGTHEEKGPAHIRRHAISDDGMNLLPGEVFSECTNGFFDGFCVDTDNNIWTSAHNGVHCLNAKGELIGTILIPEIVANVCFGGIKRNRLFITATTSLYSVYVNSNGIALV